jgi:hypothetical protein
MASYRGEFPSSHPKFPEGGDAACNASAKPVDPNAPKIKYTEEDDKAIDEFIRERGGFKLLVLQLPALSTLTQWELLIIP